MADEKEEIIDLTELIERGRPTPADAKPVEEHVQALNDQKTLKEAAELDAMLNSLDANKKKKKNDAEEMDLADMDKMLNELGLAPKEEERTPNTVDTLLGKAGLAMPEKTAQSAKDSGSPQASPAAKTAAQGQNHHDDLDLDALLNEALQTAEQLKGDTPATETAHGQADQDLDALIRSDPASAPETPTATSEDIDALLAQAAQPTAQPAPKPASAPAEIDLDALLDQAAKPEQKPAPATAAQPSLDADLDALLAQAAQPAAQPAPEPAPASAEADLDALLAQAAQPEQKPAPATAAQPSLDADLDALLAQAAQPAAQPAPEPAPASAEVDLAALLAQAAQPEEKPAPATAAQPSLDADLDALLAQAAQPAAQPAPEPAPASAEADLDALLAQAAQPAAQPAPEPAPASAEIDLDALLAQATQPEEKPAPATAAQPSLDADLDALLAQAAQPAVQPAPEPAPASAEVDLDALLAQAAQPEEKPAPAEETTRAVDPLDFESLLAQANANINDTEDKDLTEAEAPAAAVMTETAAENLDADALLAQMPVEVTAQPTPDTEASADAIPSSPDAKEAEEAEAAPAQPDLLPETEGIEATSLDGQPDAFAAQDATDAEQVLPEALLETIPASAGLSPAESDGQSPAEAGPSVMESIADSLTDAAVPPQEPRPDSEAFPLAPEALTAGAAPESPIGENGTEEPAPAEVAAASSMPQPAAGGLDDLFTEGSEHNRRLMELVSAAVAEGVAAAQPASELPGNDDGVLAARLDALEERFTTFTARLDETVAASVEKAVQGIHATIESSLNDRLQALADAQGEARAEAEAGINERLQAAADAQAAAREEESQALDARLQELSARLDALAAQSDAMKPLEEKINALQERLEAAESDRKSAGAVAAVEERLAEQKREGEAAAARMDALENRLDALSPTFNERVEKAAAAAAARILREEIANLLKE